MAVKCNICGHEERDWLADHLLEAHGLSVEQYLDQHKGAPTASQRLLDRWEKQRSKTRRALPPKANELTVNIAGVEFPVNPDVPAEACLPLPPEYRVPRHGGLGKDVQHAVVSLKRRRSIYIWGLPGSGKDALLHAFSALTRTPAAIFQVQPGIDIQGWFFARAFNESGTYYEEGEALRALRDGFLTPSGRRIPYLLAFSDMDRMDRAQAEYMRLITDSIQGRVKGPGGATYPVLPGTVIAATANTAGAGDSRGRMVSSNVLDASILDRFERKFQFRWMDWRDEEPIVRAKHPLLVERCPDVFATMGRVTETLRKAIAAEELYAEFSHRALCTILGHAEDLIHCSGGTKVPSKLLKKAARAWLDGLPDEDTRQAARNLIDPHLKGGAIDEGDTSHINDGNLADGWS
jgi:MoxR-like ATPase